MDVLPYTETSNQNNGMPDLAYTPPVPTNWFLKVDDSMSFHPRHSHSTLSEPEESMSSDPEYFDEDDMYYASYDDESVRSSPESVNESLSDSEDMVWHFLSFDICRWSDIWHRITFPWSKHWWVHCTIPETISYLMCHQFKSVMNFYCMHSPFGVVWTTYYLCHRRCQMLLTLPV